MLITRLSKQDFAESKATLEKLLTDYSDGTYVLEFKPDRMVHIRVPNQDEIEELMRMEGFHTQTR